MAAQLYTIVIDARDPATLAHFWCEVLGYRVLYQDADEVTIGASPTTVPGLCFVPVPEGKDVKNRLHLDLAPDDQSAEIERITGLGATRVDVGQGDDVTWEVLADPEGNEFCVLTPRRSLVM